MGKYVLVVALLVGLSDSAFARDDGRYADNPLKSVRQSLQWQRNVLFLRRWLFSQ